MATPTKMNFPLRFVEISQSNPESSPISKNFLEILNSQIFKLFFFLFQLADHDRDMTLVTQILWGKTTHVSKKKFSRRVLTKKW